VYVGATLAHEMMHAWFGLQRKLLGFDYKKILPYNNFYFFYYKIFRMEYIYIYIYIDGRYEKLDLSIEELICEVVAYKWLEWLDPTINDSSYKNKEFVRKLIARAQMMKNGDKEFVAAKRAVDKYGLKATLEYIAYKIK
jgi:hypothetical protein